MVFTGGGTEANNLAIRGVAEATAKRRIVTSSIEHPATVSPCRYLAEYGWRVDRVAVDHSGRVLFEQLRDVIGEGTALVTVMHANNETGTMQPLAEIAGIAHDRGILVHTDAAQSVGRIRTKVNELGVALLSIAGHHDEPFDVLLFV